MADNVDAIGVEEIFLKLLGGLSAGLGVINENLCNSNSEMNGTYRTVIGKFPDQRVTKPALAMR